MLATETLARKSSLSLSAAYSGRGVLMPRLGVYVPFAEVFYVNGGIAAAKEPLYDAPLLMSSIAFGNINRLDADSLFYYRIGAEVRRFTSRQYENLATAAAFFFGRQWKHFRIEAGTEITVQHHLVSDALYFPLTDKRVYNIVPGLRFGSPYGNLALSAGAGGFAAAFSWHFNLEGKQ